MPNPTDLARMVPGFDFLQNLMKGAGMPNMGQWIAPTIDPQELEKRIAELKTVQFWLDNNVKLLGATIQALEVQRMTLSTLHSMNLPLTDLRDALTIGKPAVAPSPAPAPKAAPRAGAPAGDAPAAAAAPAVDPLQWWSALTQQFSELAGQVMKDGAAAGSRSLGGGKSTSAAKRTAGGTRGKGQKPA